MKTTTTKREIIPFDELVRVDRLVQDQPGISLDELIEATGIPRGRVRTILIRLEARGRVRRRQGTEQFEPVAGGAA